MRTEAQKRAEDKYRKSDKFNRTIIGSNMTKSEAEKIREAAAKFETTPSKFMLNAALYCIKNDIDPRKE